MASTAAASRTSQRWVSTVPPVSAVSAAAASARTVGAQLEEAAAHAEAEAGAAAGDEDAFALEQVGFEHGTAP